MAAAVIAMSTAYAPPQLAGPMSTATSATATRRLVHDITMQGWPGPYGGFQPKFHHDRGTFGGFNYGPEPHTPLRPSGFPGAGMAPPEISVMRMMQQTERLERAGQGPPRPRKREARKSSVEYDDGGFVFAPVSQVAQAVPVQTGAAGDSPNVARVVAHKVRGAPRGRPPPAADATYDFDFAPSDAPPYASHRSRPQYSPHAARPPYTGGQQSPPAKRLDESDEVDWTTLRDHARKLLAPSEGALKRRAHELLTEALASIDVDEVESADLNELRLATRDQAIAEFEEKPVNPALGAALEEAQRAMRALAREVYF